jgi:signal transduction histidine kinase
MIIGLLLRYITPHYTFIMHLIDIIPLIPVPCLLVDRATGEILFSTISALELGYASGNFIPYECLKALRKPKSEITNDGRHWSLSTSDTSQGLFIVAVEITTQVDENQRIADRLQHQESFIGRLLRHDLTSPLATISYLLCKAYGKDDKESLGKAIKSVNRVMSIVERSGYLFGKGGGHKESFRAVDEIRECLNDLELHVEQSKAKIEIIGNGTMLYGEIVRLRQVFLNLISNAIKFKSPARTPQITITVEKLARITIVEVKDNGIGIPETFFEEIFAPAKKLHSRVDFEGEGLGLAIVKEIVEEHQGTITVNSKLGEGSTFTVRLPYYDSPTTLN